MSKQIWQLFWTYLKIGTFTIGGGYVMLTYVQREIVDNHHWMDEKEFLNMFALAQAAPGLIAVNTAIFVGWCVAKNALKTQTVTPMMAHLYTSLYITAAILGAVLPSIVIILLIAVYLADFKHMDNVEAAFKGVRPAVVALIAATVLRLARKI